MTFLHPADESLLLQLLSSVQPRRVDWNNVFARTAISELATPTRKMQLDKRNDGEREPARKERRSARTSRRWQRRRTYSEPPVLLLQYLVAALTNLLQSIEAPPEPTLLWTAAFLDDELAILEEPGAMPLLVCIIIVSERFDADAERALLSIPLVHFHFESTKVGMDSLSQTILGASDMMQETKPKLQTRTAERRVIRTRRVMRPTVLSNLSSFQRDLEDDKFEHLLREMSLPTHISEEYSDYEEYEEEYYAVENDEEPNSEKERQGKVQLRQPVPLYSLLNLDLTATNSLKRSLVDHVGWAERVNTDFLSASDLEILKKAEEQDTVFEVSTDDSFDAYSGDEFYDDYDSSDDEIGGIVIASQVGEELRACSLKDELHEEKAIVSEKLVETEDDSTVDWLRILFWPVRTTIDVLRQKEDAFDPVRNGEQPVKRRMLEDSGVSLEYSLDETTLSNLSHGKERVLDVPRGAEAIDMRLAGVNHPAEVRARDSRSQKFAGDRSLIQGSSLLSDTSTSPLTEPEGTIGGDDSGESLHISDTEKPTADLPLLRGSRWPFGRKMASFWVWSPLNRLLGSNGSTFETAESLTESDEESEDVSKPMDGEDELFDDMALGESAMDGFDPPPPPLHYPKQHQRQANFDF